METKKKNIIEGIQDIELTLLKHNNNIAEINNLKQDKLDENLETTDKTVVGAINELNAIDLSVIDGGDF
ncbi:MAG: hypothetical protein M0R03_21875 [Novosphingobium sp.]|nr:hypothetical protein [Novosphingobium sp.]